MDKEVYQVGEPVVASVRLQNEGPGPVVVPRFDVDSVHFLRGTNDSAVQVEREPVYSRSPQSEPAEVAAGKSLSRRFLFTRLSDEAGEYALLASFKGAMSAEAVQTETVYSEPVPFRVVEQTALKRDPTNGLILKAQAVELARSSVGGQVKAHRAVLMPLAETGLYTWVVLLKTAPGGGPEEQKAVQVNAYTGKVSPLELDLALEDIGGRAADGAAVPAGPDVAAYRQGSKGQAEPKRSGGQGGPPGDRPRPVGDVPQEGGDR